MAKIHEILKEYWGFDKFRSPQEEIIQHVLSKKDTLALLPTGGGKSICFQVPALAQEGTCLVVSPLIALMKDQVDNLQKRGISAACVNSTMHPKQIDRLLDNAMQGMYKFLYISPERIHTDIFLARVKQMNISLLAIDEAHCISQWGYDFRPAYLKIVELRALLPQVPCIALTATATKEVVADIHEKLNFSATSTFRKSFARSNLCYVAIEEEHKLAKLLHIIQKVPGTGIVYVRNRKRCKEIALFLDKNEVSADYYHAGLSNEDRERKQSNWIQNKTRIIVCTNAFGMGIDKPDVRLVVHLDLPPDIESYYQEAGRAGRDEHKSYAVLLYHSADASAAMDLLRENEASIEEIKSYYELLCTYLHLAVGSGLNEIFEFMIEDFCQKNGLPIQKVLNAFSILEQQEIVHFIDAIYQPSKLMFTCNNEDLYKLQISHKHYEPLIKLLLRSYGGLFENYVIIKESFLANKLKCQVADVKKAFVLLQEHKYLEYLPENNSSKLQMLQARHSKNNLLLDINFINSRRKLKKIKLEDIIWYASSSHLCRTRMLCNYFDDQLQADCQVCDVCLKKKKFGLATPIYNSISEDIRNLIALKSQSISSIKEALPNYQEQDVVQTIQWMLETKVIVQNEIGKFELVLNKFA